MNEQCCVLNTNNTTFWKEIQGYRETYLINTNGDVFIKERPGARGYVVHSRILSQNLNSSGYLRVSLRLDNDEKSKEYFVHRLVAQAFIPNPSNKPYVNHIDGNKTNNRVDNLEWVTRSENEKHAWQIGLKTPEGIGTKGEKHGMHKLTSENVLFILNNHKRNGGCYSTGELARIFNVNPQTITEIIGRRIWKCLNY